MEADEHIHLLEVEIHDKQKELDKCFSKYEALHKNYVKTLLECSNLEETIQWLEIAVAGVTSLLIILVILLSFIH